MNDNVDTSKFVSANPNLDFTFLYPSDWELREIRGASYDEVFIIGPRNREDTFSLAFSVQVTSLADKEVPDLEELARNYLAKSKHLEGFGLVSRSSGSVEGVYTKEVEIVHTAPLPIDSAKPKMTSIVERVIFVNRGKSLYEIMYTAAEEDYQKYLPVFEEMIHTFQFHD